MKEEFNLSENIYADGTRLLVEDVKEFIKRLKELNKRMLKHCVVLNQEIDKLAGEKLIWKKNLI